jgi:hypothetical protein
MGSLDAWSNGSKLVTTRAVKSNRNRIVFLYRIERFCLYRIESKADRIEWNFRFSIRFNSIRSGLKGKQEKPWTVIVENEKFAKRHHKRDSQIFLPSWWTIPLWNWPTYKWSIFFMTAAAVFVSNRIESYLDRIDIESKSNRYRIEIESKSNRNRIEIESKSNRNRIEIESKSNRNRIERFLHLVNRKSNRNQFDLTALVTTNQLRVGKEQF